MPSGSSQISNEQFVAMGTQESWMVSLLPSPGGFSKTTKTTIDAADDMEVYWQMSDLLRSTTFKLI